jgi:hypothetical protein
MLLRYTPWSRILRSPDGEGNDGGNAFLASLPEGIRAHEGLKDVKDVGDLGTRYVSAITPKPFAETLPKDIAAEAMFKDIKDLDGLARSYHGQAKLLGVPKDQLLRLPADDKPENWAPIYDRLGRPEKADAYKLTLPEGVQLNAEAAKPIFEKAHELGLSQKQLDGLYTTLRTTAEANGAAAKAKADGEVAASLAALKTEWGVAYDQKIADATQAIDHFAKALNLGDGLKADLERSGLGNNPALAKLFAGLAANLKEDGKLTGRAAGSESLSSPVEARQNINALRADKNFMKQYTDKRDPGHKAAVDKMAALHQQAYPEPGQVAA